MDSCEVREQSEEERIVLFLEDLYNDSGYDFREYAYSSMRRRILKAVAAEHLDSIESLRAMIYSEPECFRRFLSAVSVTATSMFRGPAFYRCIREHVIPYLRTYPSVRIWHAGCATGEEAYSMAIMLQEEGLHSRSRIYATDINEHGLQTAREGLLPVNQLDEFADNYKLAGGRGDFYDYVTCDLHRARLRSDLRSNIVFAQHNLVTDGSFNEFHLIVCRNVMIYFQGALQARVLSLLHESLVRFGVLGLGREEAFTLGPRAGYFERLDEHERLYRRMV